MDTFMPRAKALRQALGKTNIEEKRPRVMLTVEEASRTLHISRWTLYRLMRDRQLASVKIGSKRLIPAASIEKFTISLLEAQGY
jgi:excisionase family DNA binding protein